MEDAKLWKRFLVFCSTQEHALTVRNMINDMKAVRDVDIFGLEFTADDGSRSEESVRSFQDNDFPYPYDFHNIKEIVNRR